MTEPTAAGARQFKCTQCGARLEFEPGTDAMQCPYCGTRNEVAATGDAVRELDFEAKVHEFEASAEKTEILSVKCRECGADSTLPPDVTSAPCPFCGSGLVSTAQSRKVIKPGAVLPFQVPREKARELFHGWIRRLWFAPGDVKRLAAIDTALSGVYVPYWTFDARATTQYAGERGDAYYVTERYTEMVNGRSETRTRQVRKIRWTPRSGVVRDAFDDVLVRATNSLPAQYLDALEPWDLDKLVPYRDEYLAGFRTDSYQVGLPEGFVRARQIVDPAILRSCERDIGGDEQRVHSRSTRFSDVTFKHVLFPVWISAYRYQGRIFRFLVNARTGEVQGERPWSAAKIVLLVVGVLTAVGALVALLGR